MKKIYKSLMKRKEESLFVFLALLSLAFAGMCFGEIKSNSQSSLPAPKNNAQVVLEKKIKRTVSDYPIKKMAPYLAGKNEKVASFLVAIAKKESDWGKYAPKKRGKECFNYWGYKGAYNRNAAGYSCFDSPAQAVNVVGKRIERLIAQKVDTPQEMILWKCGQGCTARSSADAAKWVSDVNLYYKKMYN